MPVFDFVHWTQEAGGTLDKTGPIIPVEIRMPSALQAFHAEHSLPLPAPISGYALIDTGAFATAVDENVFIQLQVPPIDEIQTNTPHGASKSNIYPAMISFPAINLEGLPMERVVGCNLKWTTPDNKIIIMLLGRDLLKYFLLIYNGKLSTITLAY